MEDFDPFLELPPIQTEALRIYNDSAIQARFRDRFQESERNRQNNSNGLESGIQNSSDVTENQVEESSSSISTPEAWETERNRKRGFRSPLNNLNKRKVTEHDISNLLSKFKTQDENEEDPFDEEEKKQDEAAAIEGTTWAI